VRLSRQAGARLPANAVSVAYSTKWANPCRPADRGVAANQAARGRYRRYLGVRPDLMAAARGELRGKDLACWCAPDLACHADVLLQLAGGVALDHVQPGAVA
jgi:hypothetical protein